MLAVRWWRRFPLIAAGASSWTETVPDIVWPILILTRIKKHWASGYLCLYLIVSFRVWAYLGRARTNASGLDVSCHMVIAQLEALGARLGQAAT